MSYNSENLRIAAHKSDVLYTMKNPAKVLFVPFLVFSLGALAYTGLAAPEQSLQKVLQSKAYHNFRKRSVSEKSKILYLIDRYQYSGVKIMYNGIYFDSPMAAHVARWFFFRFYKNETVEQWLVKWCHRSVPSGQLIWCKFPDGSFRLSKDVLSEAFAELEQAIAQTDLAEIPAAAGAAEPVE